MSNQARVKPEEAFYQQNLKAGRITYFSRKNICCTIYLDFLFPFFLPVQNPGSQPQQHSHSICFKAVYCLTSQQKYAAFSIRAIANLMFKNLLQCPASQYTVLVWAPKNLMLTSDQSLELPLKLSVISFGPVFRF